MRIVRGVVLAIAAMLTLLGGTARVAYASPEDSTSPDDAGISASADPGDPGFPPDQ